MIYGILAELEDISAEAATIKKNFEEVGV